MSSREEVAMPNPVPPFTCRPLRLLPAVVPFALAYALWAGFVAATSLPAPDASAVVQRDVAWQEIRFACRQ
jgi:hypothetical protein